MSNILPDFNSIDLQVADRLASAELQKSATLKAAEATIQAAQLLSHLYDDFEAMSGVTKAEYDEANRLIKEKTAEIDAELRGKTFMLRGTVYGKIDPAYEEVFTPFTIAEPLGVVVEHVEAIGQVSCTASNRFQVKTSETLRKNGTWPEATILQPLDINKQIGLSTSLQIPLSCDGGHGFDPIALFKITDRHRRDIGMRPMEMSLYDVKGSDRYVMARLRDVELS